MPTQATEFLVYLNHPKFELAMRFAKPILEEAGITSAEEFAKIRHAISMREYRERMKSLAAKGNCASKGKMV